MGMEVAGSELPQVNGETKVHDKENGKVDVSEPIKFGSHGIDEQQPKGEANVISNASFPKDAVDEWPATPQLHSFWFVKYRSYEDPNLKAKFDQTDKEIQKKNQLRSQILDDLKAKRSERAELLAALKALGAESSQYWAVINEKRQEMRPLQDALGTLRGAGREKGVGLCSTEEELNEIIRSLEYQMHHESLSLKEEKQLLREIKELEETRPKVIANTAMRSKIQESLGQKEAIQDQVKLLGTDLDGVRKQKAVVRAKMDHLSEQVKALDDQISALQKELEIVTEKKKIAFDTVQQLRKKRDEGNAYFYQYRSLLNSAKELAAKKDVKALEELAYVEVEKFMSNWSNSKAIRDDYEKRILTSLDMRQLSRDGRMRNPDERPLVMVDAARPSQTEAAPKTITKLPKEDHKTNGTEENLTPQMAQKEAKNSSKESKTAVEREIEEEDDVFTVEKPKRDLHKEDEIDENKLREMKKEEEKEKQRQALERKKKLQEKAAAKAALRAQKEAEKKQKEREKKLKKKESISAPETDEEPTEKDTVVDEPEKSDNIEEDVETPPPAKAKERKENTLRYRKASKARGSLPKAVLKKKKSTNYMVWASAAAPVVVILLALGYSYLL